MRVPDLQESKKTCEGCNQNIKGETVMGLEADNFSCSQIRLCDSCGPIDLPLMQYCRELVLGCNEN
jgi:hypothetical protein